MPMRADNPQIAHLFTKSSGDLPSTGIDRKQTVWVKEHQSCALLRRFPKDNASTPADRAIWRRTPKRRMIDACT